MNILPIYHARCTYISSGYDKPETRRRLALSIIIVIIMFWVAAGMLLSSQPDIALSIFRLSYHSLSVGDYLFVDQSRAEDPSYLWQGLKAGEHCLRHATREYTARLHEAAVPAGEDVMKACHDRPVEIHGKTLYTDFCQNLGFGRGVWGFWIVNFDEPDCETEWGEFTDLGCIETKGSSDTEAPARRIESHLKNLQHDSDWQFMCVTTPADIYGHHYLTPRNCLNLGHSDILGTWDVHDKSCYSDSMISSIKIGLHSNSGDTLLDQNQAKDFDASNILQVPTDLNSDDLSQETR